MKAILDEIDGVLWLALLAAAAVLGAVVFIVCLVDYAAARIDSMFEAALFEVLGR